MMRFKLYKYFDELAAVFDEFLRHVIDVLTLSIEINAKKDNRAYRIQTSINVSRGKLINVKPIN